jgi:hypothetical protein
LFNIFTGVKPATVSQNTLFHGGARALNNRRPFTSSSSTISSQSMNFEHGRNEKDRKGKTLKESKKHRYLLDSGKYCSYMSI